MSGYHICDHCGERVPIHWSGDIGRWECGHCGNFGEIRRTQPEEDPGKRSFEVDLDQTWRDLRAKFRTSFPRQYDELAPNLGKVVLHTVSEALIQRKEPLGEEKEEALRRFLTETPDLGCTCTMDELWEAVWGKTPLYEKTAALSNDICGSFWGRLIRAFPKDTTMAKLYRRMDAPLWELFRIYAYYVEDHIGWRPEEEVRPAIERQREELERRLLRLRRRQSDAAVPAPEDSGHPDGQEQIQHQSQEEVQTMRSAQHPEWMLRGEAVKSAYHTCSNCGARARLTWFGDTGRWHCGYCGNFGEVVMRYPFRLDQAQAWKSLRTLLRASFPEQYDQVESDLGKVVLYTVTRALSQREKPLGEEKEEALRRFLEETPDLGCTCGMKDIQRSYWKKVPLYEETAALSEEACGTFWEGLMQAFSGDVTQDGIGMYLDGPLGALLYFYTYYAKDVREDDVVGVVIGQREELEWQFIVQYCRRNGRELPHRPKKMSCGVWFLIWFIIMIALSVWGDSLGG